MNKEEALKILVNYMQQAVDFSTTKAPEVLQQYINLKFMFYAFSFLGVCILLFILFLVLKALIKKSEEDEGIIFFVSGFWIVLFIAAIVILIQCIGLFFYPEGWLLQHFLK